MGKDELKPWTDPDRWYLCTVCRTEYHRGRAMCDACLETRRSKARKPRKKKSP